MRTVEYHHEDLLCLGQLAAPQGRGPHPAVMVMHSGRGMGGPGLGGNGLGGIVLEKIRILADLGYVGFASDMYGGGSPIFADARESGTRMLALHETPETLRARVLAGFAALQRQPEVDPNRIAAIGYCFGGQCVLELARSGADVKAVVYYHGLLTTAFPARAGAIKGVVAAFAGGQDPYAPQDHIDGFCDEMRAANASWHLTVYADAWHGFTDPRVAEIADVIPGVAYHALADRMSWASTVALLDAVLR